MAILSAQPKRRQRMTLAIRASALMAASLLAAPTEGLLTAGSPMPLDEQGVPGCPADRCRIQLTRVAGVSGAQASNVRNYSIFVEQDAHGQYLTTTARGNQVVAFDKNGSASLVGPQDNSPRVLVTIVPASRGNHRAYVFDALSNSLITLNMDGSIGQTRVFPGFPSFMLPSGHFIVAQQIRSRDLAGHPVHVVDTQGNVLRSFGADVPEYRSDLDLITTRLATPGRDGTVWTVAPGRYVFEQWDPSTGQRARRVPVKTSWFTEAVRGISDPMKRPNDVIEAIWEQSGVLWALARVADEKWVAPTTPPAHAAIVPAEYDRRYDWMLEAIDPASGRVLAQQRFPRAIWGRSSSSALLASLTDGGEKSGVDVWRFTLAER